MTATEIRCPQCGAARFEAIGILLVADKLFPAYLPGAGPEPCERCGYVFHPYPATEAA